MKNLYGMGADDLLDLLSDGDDDDYETAGIVGDDAAGAIVGAVLAGAVPQIRRMSAAKRALLPASQIEANAASVQRGLAFLNALKTQAPLRSAQQSALVAQARAHQEAMAQRLALPPYNPFSPVVDYTPPNPTKARRYPIGFTGNVLAGAGATITNQPQVIFRPERISIPDTIGVNFSIVDFKVGNVSQFGASGSVPALTYSQTAIGTDQGFDTAQVSQTLSFAVQNLDLANPHLFQATVFGTAVTQLHTARKHGV